MEKKKTPSKLVHGNNVTFAWEIFKPKFTLKQILHAHVSLQELPTCGSRLEAGNVIHEDFKGEM